MPEVLSTSPFTPASLQQAVARELADAPENALEATVLYEKDGELRATAAIKIDRDRWVLMGGGFVKKDKTRTDYGGFGSVRVTF